MSLLKRIEKSQQQTTPANAPAGASGSGTPASKPSSGGEQSKLTEMRLKRAPASTSPTRDAYLDLKTRVQNKLLAEMDPSMDVSKTDEVGRRSREVLRRRLTEEHCSEPRRAPASV
jgi:pilus assembly protein CpaF